MSAVASREPSSTRSTSTGSPHASAGTPPRTCPTAASSSRATTIAKQRRAGSAAAAAGRAPGSSACGSTARRGRAGSTPGSSEGTSGRPRAAFGDGIPSSVEIVCASSSTERGSSEIAPGTAPRPQTTNGTGRSPQSR